MAMWPKLGLALTAGAALVALGAAAPSQPTAAPASHLLFASNRDGDGDGYATDPAGRRYAALTVDSEDERNFVASRDGRHLAFRRTRSGAVYVADGAGRHLREVGEGFPVGWSPDGSLLAFFSQEGAEASGIRVVNADGTGARPLVAGGGSFTEFEGWSADGQELAFTLEAVDPDTGDPYSELRTVDLGGSQHLLHSHLGEMWYSATWSPSSHELAFRADFQIVVVDADSGTTKVVANAESLGGPVWSPDGTKLLFSRGHGAGQNSLAVADLARGTTSQLVSTGPIEYEQVASYSWSPAGDRVAWLDTNGLFDVRADGQGRTRLRNAPWIGWPPGVGPATWSPNGDALAFEEGGLRSIRPDGTGLKTLAERGSVELLGWVPGPVPSAAPRAATLPAL
jgi:Tol biopolymer transport system component